MEMKTLRELADDKFNGRKQPKVKKSCVMKRDEVALIRAKFPNKVPVVVERFQKEMYLPDLDKTKFLVPQEITMSQFLTIIRNRMHIDSTQAVYMMVNNRSIISLSRTLSEVYAEHRAEDGFLHVTYASQEVFGCGAGS
ncbi:microtubule-associated proteins 1A/1B light chain 3C-like [Bacillus rossius redtenbacheri]|uniref:microtubule-associated proteins 1A/1B light chain 3C-like n=1 Tax=Bacillus rossius redtenbacheri TaxID=93214 RepID=UPI002FDE98C1